MTSFLSSPEGPLGGQIFAPTLAKGHGGVEAKISQPACKRFEVKSHSLTLDSAIQSRGLSPKGNQTVTKADHMDTSSQEGVRGQMRLWRGSWKAANQPHWRGAGKNVPDRGTGWWAV